MTKETYVEVTIDKNDILSYLDFDFYDLDYPEWKEMTDKIKTIVLSYTEKEDKDSGDPILNSEDILNYLARNPTISHEVINGLNEKEANN